MKLSENMECIHNKKQKAATINSLKVFGIHVIYTEANKYQFTINNPTRVKTNFSFTKRYSYFVESKIK